MSDSKPQIQEDQRTPRRKNAKRENERERRQEGGKKEGERERSLWLQAEVQRQPGLTYTLTGDQFNKVYTLRKKEKPYASVPAKSLQSCLTLGGSMNHSPPGSSVRGALQTGILEGAAGPSSRGSSQPRDPTCVSVSPALSGRFFTTNATWESLPTSRRIICKLQKTQSWINRWVHYQSWRL